MTLRLLRRARGRRVGGPFGLLLALLLAACGGGEPPQAQHVTLTDFSGSAGTLAQILNREVENSLHEAAAAGARLTIAPVTKDSVGDPSGVVQVDFRGEQPKHLPDNDLFRERFRAQLVATGMQRYRAWRAEHQLSMGSDYQGALLRAGDLLTDAGAAGSLTIVGDGLSNLGALITTAPDLDPASCAQTASGELQAHRLPDLQGVTVRWVAGGRNDTASLSPLQQANLESCWKQVINVLGGVTEAGWWSPGQFTSSSSSAR